MALLMKFECLQNYELYLDRRLDLLKTDVRKGLENAFLEYDEGKLQIYLYCHYMFDTYFPSEPLVQNLQKIIKNSIKLARNAVIKLNSKAKVNLVRYY